MSNLAPAKNFRVSIKGPNSSPGIRTRDVGDEGNPLSSLHFEPAWDSDELYDALRIAYPRIKSHKDRFLRAVIEFYDAELGRARTLERGLDTPPSSPPTMPNSDGFFEPRERSASSEDSETSGQSSKPDKTNRNPLKRARSDVDGMGSMQAMFSIVPGGTKPRTKRPMTEEERKQYRHTKRVGACEPCRRRKKKCVCKLAEQTQAPEAKRARIDDNHPPSTFSPLSVRETEPETSHVQIDSCQQFPGPGRDDIPSNAILDAVIEETEDDLAVSRITKSQSLSPLSLVFDTKFDLSSFLLCPELNLGDLAMTDIPSPKIGFNDGPIVFEAPAMPRDDFPQAALSPRYFDQCEAYINFSGPDDIPSSPAQKEVMNRQNAVPLGYPDADFTASLALITRATTALAPFSRFAPDAQLLLGDLRTLKLQLKLLRKPLPFLSKSITYYNTVRDVALDIREPLQEFLARLEKMCGVEDLDGQRLGLSYTSTAFQLQKLEWVRSVKDDARRLRGMLASRSTTISSLMTLVSMETLTELHNLFHPMQKASSDTGMGIVSDFSNLS